MSRSTLNDAFHLDATAMMQCCNASGLRGLYDLWRYSIHEERPEGNKSYIQEIHFRFSNETPELRVVSAEPSSGKLEITARQDSIIKVRLPEGEKHANLLELGAGQALILDVSDGYISFNAGHNQKYELNYHLAERRQDYRVGSQDRFLKCCGFWKGDTLIKIEPKGTFYPLYDRQAA